MADSLPPPVGAGELPHLRVSRFLADKGVYLSDASVRELTALAAAKPQMPSEDELCLLASAVFERYEGRRCEGVMPWVLAAMKAAIRAQGLLPDEGDDQQQEPTHGS